MVVVDALVDQRPAIVAAFLDEVELSGRFIPVLSATVYDVFQNVRPVRDGGGLRGPVRTAAASWRASCGDPTACPPATARAVEPADPAAPAVVSARAPPDTYPTACRAPRRLPPTRHIAPHDARAERPRVRHPGPHTGIPLSFRERAHAYKAGLLLAKMIAQVGAPEAGELEPAAHFDAGEGW